METRQGRAFSGGELDWAWSKIGASPWVSKKVFGKAMEARRGSKALQQAITPLDTVVLPSGRIRARCTYTQARNGPFQGEAADGNKLALYELIRAGFRVIAFVHDEVLIELPEADDYRPQAERLAGIMISAMKRICPDVEIRVEYG